MKITKLLFVMLFSIAVAACGGGGGGASGGSSVSGTAAQYFTKNAVGNTWTMLRTDTYTPPGQPPSITTETTVESITASAGGVDTYSYTYTSNGVTTSATMTAQLDATGALVFSDGTNTIVDLPATFLVGTAWVAYPADPTNGVSAFNSTIAAFNVTRTVPAGTFTDCLQINTTWSSTSGGVTTTYNDSIYVSPSAGNTVEETGSSSSSDGSTDTWISQLQAGYIANP